MFLGTIIMSMLCTLKFIDFTCLLFTIVLLIWIRNIWQRDSTPTTRKRGNLQIQRYPQKYHSLSKALNQNKKLLYVKQYCSYLQEHYQVCNKTSMISFVVFTKRYQRSIWKSLSHHNWEKRTSRHTIVYKSAKKLHKN